MSDQPDAPLYDEVAVTRFAAQLAVVDSLADLGWHE